MPKVNIETIAIDGLGYGVGTISLEDRLNLPSSDPEHVAELQYAKLEGLIQSPDILVRVDDIQDQPLDDDGCGDGRGVQKVLVKGEGGLEQKSRSLHRAKVFGGSPVMAGASLLATSKETPESVEALFLGGIDALQKHEIDFGGHTDGHATEEKSGCGAIDNGPSIVNNAINFAENITSNIDALGVPTEGINDIFDEYKILASKADTQTYAGQKVMKHIFDNNKVVKELDGGHREVAVVLNMVEGYTVNQEKVRETTNGTLQVFAVDVWRLINVAQRLNPHSENDQHKAFLSMLIYTLATAATLTKGDLPVYRVSPQENFATV